MQAALLGKCKPHFSVNAESRSETAVVCDACMAKQLQNSFPRAKGIPHLIYDGPSGLGLGILRVSDTV